MYFEFVLLSVDYLPASGLSAGQCGCGKPFPASVTILSPLPASLSESSPCSYFAFPTPFSHVMPRDTALSFASIISPIEFLSPSIISAFSTPLANPKRVSITSVRTLQFALEASLFLLHGMELYFFPFG